jgi:hypothetical protein
LRDDIFQSFSFFDIAMDYRIEELLTKIHSDLHNIKCQQLAESIGVSFPIFNTFSEGGRSKPANISKFALAKGA